MNVLDPSVHRIRQQLAVNSLFISNLPGLPGYNGSILQIDDVGAATVAKELSEAADFVTRIQPLIAIVQKLAQLRNGLVNSNSIAEEKAAELADQAHQLIFNLTGVSA